MPKSINEETPLEPLTEYIMTPQSLYKEALIGCLIVAGGQGTRLGIGNSPKGKCPITSIKKKSLFQLFAEKAIAASRCFGRSMPLAIMTSPLNHDETIAFFKENNFFGLEKDQISFFKQGMLPFLDERGKTFLENGQIAMGPDGNGLALANFYKSEIFSEWKKRDIRFVNFVLIDNPLANPFDLALPAIAIDRQADIVIKCVARDDLKEKVGVLVKEKGQLKVVEYTELPENERDAVDAGGRPKHLCANISLFCFSIDFIERCASRFEKEMPLHAVKKKSEGQWIWKFERFIFDVLAFTNASIAVLVERKEAFAPLKNSSGTDSIESVQAALQLQDKKIWKSITGIDPPARLFELAQEFHYPTEDLKKKWFGKTLPKDEYVE